MSYSIDLKKRVVNFVRAGGSKAEACRRFSISKWCIDQWCKRDDLAPISPPGRPRKNLDWKTLRKDIMEKPDKALKRTCQRA